MKVLFITQTTAYGGTELHTLRLIASFDPAAVESTIVCFGDDPYSPLLPSHAPAVAKVHRMQRPAGFSGYRALMKRFGPDIVVFVSGWHGLFPLPAYLAARLSPARRICTIEHSTAEARAPWPKSWLNPAALYRWMAGWHARTTLANAVIGLLSQQTICVSENNRRRLIRDYAYPAWKTSTVRHGIDTSSYRPSDEARQRVRRQLGIGVDENVLVVVGRLHRDKGLDVLFEALGQLRQSGAASKCIVVGDGPLRNELGLLVAANGLSAVVSFVGHRDDVRPYLAAADIFALPSRTEGLPYSLLEAISSGLPCIVSRVGGMPEVITNGVEGLLVPPESSTDLARAITKLLSDAELRLAMGKRARARAEAEFDERKSLANMRARLLGRDVVQARQSSRAVTQIVVG